MTVVGLRPGLLQKYNNTSTSAGKFEFLKAFILDPQSLSSITIETEYIEQASRDEDHNWAEVALCNLRKEYSSDAGKKFLEDKIVGQQEGRPHPQDPMNPEMRLYWIFRENVDSTKNHRSIATKISGKGNIPSNKAAQGAVADALTSHAANFSGKGGDPKGTGITKGGGTTKGGGKTKTKRKTKTKTKETKLPKVNFSMFCLFDVCFFFPALSCNPMPCNIPVDTINPEMPGKDPGRT